MSMISKLCSDLRNAADGEGYCPNRDRTLMHNAANTIELLSAKVRELNLTHDKRTETHGVCSEQATDLISRQETICTICKIQCGFDRPLDQCLERTVGYCRMEEAIESLPSAERPTGEWIDREYCQVDEDSYEVAICSECEAEVTIEYPYDNYCPNCGAKMEESHE